MQVRGRGAVLARVRTATPSRPREQARSVWRFHGSIGMSMYESLAGPEVLHPVVVVRIELGVQLSALLLPCVDAGLELAGEAPARLGEQHQRQRYGEHQRDKCREQTVQPHE